MNVSDLTLRDLEYMVAVAEFAHFGKAALALHVSQPTLSAQIKKIEGVLGVALFERNNRRVGITEQGQLIIDQSRIVLDESRKIISIAQGKMEILSGPFKLGAIASLGPYYFPYILGPLKKAFPKLEIFIKEGLTENLLEELRAGKLDAILASNTFPEDGLRVEPLFFEPFMLAMPSEHEFAHAKSLPHLKELRASDMILLEDGHCLKDQAVGFCSSNRRGNIQKLYATSIETLRQLVATGMGYTLIPKMAVHPDPRLKNLITYREFDQSQGAKRVGREIILVTREHFSRMKDIDALKNFMLKNLPKVLSMDTIE